MEETRKEWEPIREESVSLDEILNDQELTALLEEPQEPVKNLRKESYLRSRKKHDDKVIIGLMATACALCLGIIGVLAYWLTVLL